MIEGTPIEGRRFDLLFLISERTTGRDLALWIMSVGDGIFIATGDKTQAIEAVETLLIPLVNLLRGSKAVAFDDQLNREFDSPRHADWYGKHDE